MNGFDFETISDEDRFALIECFLGLLPSSRSWESRAVFVAFQLAGDRQQDQIEDTLRQLEEARPGFAEEVFAFAKDIHGVRPNTEAMDA